MGYQLAVQLYSLEELDVIITDAGAPEKTMEAVIAAGKELIICE